MGINTRTVTSEYPGAVTLVEGAISCTNFTTIQLLALELQKGVIGTAGATIVGGVIYAGATKTEIETACEAV